MTMPTVKGPVSTNVTQRFVPQTNDAATSASDLDPASVVPNARLLNFALQVVVPGNVRAVLHIPCPPSLHSSPVAAGATVGDGSHAPCVVLDAVRILAGAVALTADGVHVWVEVGAGTHTFAWC